MQGIPYPSFPIQGDLKAKDYTIPKNVFEIKGAFETRYFH